ncbi:hypothetical protein FSW04_03515 [Baekduia soli]|uniref:Uncharacterized protein n=1 Tax=Baekduia soli TaxID=496014 RepID=A0A5B8U120_9ACTN|nr:hypothetical protein [Baekduia soli]QEC46744.1 hypothetical protein FSW04_03515 [Baekduia soli]
MSSRSPILGLAALAATLAVAAPAQAAPFVGRVSTPKAQPRADHGWVITVTARTASGRNLRATAFYQFLFDGQVVSTQYPSPGKRAGTAHRPYGFTGRYRDTLLFPARAAGIPLTLRVVIRVAGKGTVKVDRKIRVRR